jgi:methylenetetrahydrofolate dehydrogenase (NADP+)/methenyltetrahydrofolate cyclohydrolase
VSKIIDGTALAAGIRARIRIDIQCLGRAPGLAIVLVGEHPASRIYVRRKRQACADVGIRAEVIEQPAGTDMRTLSPIIQQLNARTDIDGIIIQQPVPPPLDPLNCVSAVAPEKDVDGLHPINYGLLLRGVPRFIPATPKGIRALLLASGHDPTGRHVVILGRGQLVGKPLAALLVQRSSGDATVTICHTGTRDLAAITSTADILVAAMGRPKFVTPDMVKPGAVIIDVGINRTVSPTAPNGTRMVGDVDPAVYPIASAYTPVPGGVGPMTVAMLLENVVEAARRRQKLPPEPVEG